MTSPEGEQLGSAARMSTILPSGIRRIFDKAERLRLQGHDVKALDIGAPDFDTPAHIKDAAKQALDEGFVRYTANAGILPLRKAIASRLRLDCHITFDPESEIIVTVGANEAMLLCVLAMVDPGDEVLVPEPTWPHAQMCVRLAGGIPVMVPLSDQNGFQIRVEDIAARLTERTRMLLVNSPHNPTGTILSDSCLREIATLLRRMDIVVVSDEIYSRLVYEGPPAGSIAALPGMRERTLVINGFSKTYAMTGWRLGWVAGPRHFMDALLRVHQYSVTSATSFAQVGGLAALEGPHDDVVRMVQELDRRRLHVLDTIERIPGIKAVRPRGAMYVYARVDGLGTDGASFADWLLENYHVAVVPGDVFGEHQDAFVRISFGASFGDVREAMNRLEHACHRMVAEGSPRDATMTRDHGKRAG